jgi:hypothetical protein
MAFTEMSQSVHQLLKGTKTQTTYIERFKVFTTVKILVEVFWVVTPCSVVVGYQRFGGPFCLHLQGEVEDGGSTILQKRWYPTTTLHGVTNQKASTSGINSILSFFLYFLKQDKKRLILSVFHMRHAMVLLMYSTIETVSFVTVGVY